MGESVSKEIGSVVEFTYYPDEVGDFVISVSVRDISGGIAEASILIEVLPSDNDLDFIETCPSSGDNPWFDTVELRRCGPDEFDEDDDNDSGSDCEITDDVIRRRLQMLEKLIEKDNERYGDTFPEGSFNITN